jgi:molybdopterin converting factor small subunit
MAIIRISAPLKKFTGGNSEISVKATIVFDALKEIERSYPYFLSKVCDTDGNVYPYLNIFINDKNINKVKGVRTKIQENDEICIIPAGAG